MNCIDLKCRYTNTVINILAKRVISSFYIQLLHKSCYAQHIHQYRQMYKIYIENIRNHLAQHRGCIGG